jgi:hypothetical protein
MGLEPTTFCMARAGGRSLPFAPVARTGCLRGFRACERTGPNPSERRTLPFLPRDAGTEVGLASLTANSCGCRRHQRPQRLTSGGDSARTGRGSSSAASAPPASVKTEKLDSNARICGEIVFLFPTEQLSRGREEHSKPAAGLLGLLMLEAHGQEDPIAGRQREVLVTDPQRRAA